MCELWESMLEQCPTKNRRKAVKYARSTEPTLHYQPAKMNEACRKSPNVGMLYFGSDLLQK